MRFVKPSALPTLPIELVSIASQGVAVTDMSAVDACYAYNTALGTIITAGEVWVATDGNDTTGNGTEGNPYLTVRKAVQITAGLPAIVNVKAGSYDVTAMQLRNTDTSQLAGAALKHVRAAPGVDKSLVKFICTGPDVTTQAWVLDSGNIWSTVLAGTTLPFKVMFSGASDLFGYPMRLFKFADLAALQADGSEGWAWNNATRTLYVSIGGPSVEANKAQLDARFTLSNGFARININNAPILFENITFDGINIRTLNVAQAPAVFQSQMWFQSCDLLWQPTSAIVSGGGYTVVDDIAGHAFDGDFVLHNSIEQGLVPFGMEINARSTYAGDYGFSGALENSNGSSSHFGHVCRFGGVHRNTFGACVGDVANIDDGDYTSWNAGMDCRDASDSERGYGFQISVNTGSNRRRTVYLDTCHSEGQPRADILADADVGNFADVLVCGGDVIDNYVLGGVGTVTTYSRRNPG